MQITCRCLNVVIESKTSRFDTYGKPDNILQTEAFFNEDIAVIELKSVIKKLPLLVEVHKCGSWVIHWCMNCEIYTHAFDEEADLTQNTMIIVNKSLLTDPKEIASLMESELLSPVFKIIINQDVINPAFISEKGNQEMNSKLLLWIEEQTALTEERVQTYMQKQYAELEQRKARARRDFLALSRIFTKHNKIELGNTKMVVPLKIRLRDKKTTSRKDEDKVKIHHKTTTNGTSLDTEGLFDLDDIENNSVGERSEEEIASDISEGEEVFQPARRPQKSKIAQSLPVPVPQFMQEKQHSSSNESPQVPTDIAASIKALARSVHGDTIFGELPRPRFSTHL